VITADTSVHSAGEGEGGNGKSLIILSSLRLAFNTMFLALLLAGLLHLPFKIYFIKKRKQKPITAKHQALCRKYLLQTPWITSGVFTVAALINQLAMLVRMYTDETLRNTPTEFGLLRQLFYISLVASLLIILFAHYWQKHRVHILYLHHVFSPEELRERIFALRIGRLRNRLLLSNIITTMLPITIVVFYLVLSLTQISSLNISKFDASHLQVLMGKYNTFFASSSGSENILGLFYINAIDSILMFAGIGSGILVSMVYIFLFVRWTTIYITHPVGELLENIRKTGMGELSQFSIVRTNDEIGELTEGYNKMSGQLERYLSNIRRLTESYYRFVPRQFLDILGKSSYTEIELGDQVEREMTVMFSDIRSFTTLSEQMTPRENFNFINNYLGMMEPLIRKNHGFIDKFIGDAIMALFDDSPVNAVNAAIEMRNNLRLVNQVSGIPGEVDFGVGIHCGRLMLGIVGGTGRMDGTVISDAVNLASRLEGLTKTYGCSIIISQDALDRLPQGHGYRIRLLDDARVKGKNKSVQIYEVIDGEPEPQRALKTLSMDTFAKAVALYHQGAYGLALDEFTKIIADNPKDAASIMYAERCRIGGANIT
jgi:class 3 adenylate cyclase